MLNYYNTKVTVELGELIENGIKPFDFDYPSFYKGDEKTAFEQKVLDHFRFRQIGQETPARWLHTFRTRVCEIMPYYIQLYKSQELFESVEDPLESYNLTETFERNTESSGSSTVNGESSETSEQRFSDTPQGSIDNIDKYMTSATVNENGSNSETSTESSGTGSESYTLTRRGNIGVQPFGQEIKILRDSFINIDMMIINELNDLFLKVY